MGKGRDFAAEADAFARVLDNAIRDQLIAKYVAEIREALESELENMMPHIQQTVEHHLKDLTLENVNRMMDVSSMADRLLVAFKFNPEPGETIEDEDITEISRPIKRG